MPPIASGNWRLATENGFDTTPHLHHRHSCVVTKTARCLPCSASSRRTTRMEIVESRHGPKCVSRQALLELRADLRRLPSRQTTVSAEIKETVSIRTEVLVLGCRDDEARELSVRGYSSSKCTVADRPIARITYLQVLGKRGATKPKPAEHRADAPREWKNFSSGADSTIMNLFRAGHGSRSLHPR